MKQVPQHSNCSRKDIETSIQMNDEFQTTALTRTKIIEQINCIVDLVERNLKRTKNERDGCDQGGIFFSSADFSQVPTFSLDDGAFSIRHLIREEWEMLKGACRCSCSNDEWSKIYIMQRSSSALKKDFSDDLRTLVSDTHFDGFIILDMSTTAWDEHDSISPENSKMMDWSAIPPGMHSNICVADSVVHIRSCRIYRNYFVSTTFIGSNVVLINCRHVSSSHKIGNNYSCGKLKITVGAESGGGRSLFIDAESTMVDVCRQLQSRGRRESDAMFSSISSLRFNILLSGCFICDTSRVENVFLYPFSSIESACSVVNSTLFGNAKITSGSIVSNVLMQWSTSISGHSKISNVFMMEQSHLGPSSVVESTVIGPDSHASSGEIHASIIGPSTNAHHQSLLIGVLWPLGRGNVGYGANVGSNHTGRLPDQECSAGEGIFWGLSCIVKFPVDLSMAPYSMVAAGTKLVPQRITMPFSLIVESSPLVNDVVPGWVLQHSPYTLARNDKKFATRRMAMRHAYYTGWKVLRPSTIEMCRVARSILKKSLPEGNSTPFENISGIGECRLTKRARDDGIKAYDNCIHLYTLRGFLSWLNEQFDTYQVNGASFCICETLEQEFDENRTTNPLNDYSQLDWPYFPFEIGNKNSHRHEWEYQRKLLFSEFPILNEEESYSISWIKCRLNDILRLEKDLGDRITKCKRRDDRRGIATIPGYEESHLMAEMDPVVLGAREFEKTTQDVVESLLIKLGHG